MRLELHRLNVKSLKFSDRTDFADGVLSVNKSE
ncbi:MAG: hypothetical protein IJQ74_04105, partial [Synergistaceae bacterium]|nr:hypothetical protein [Synergistaceae bacterium]